MFLNTQLPDPISGNKTGGSNYYPGLYESSPTNSPNNQSQQGSAEADSLILPLSNTALTPLEKLTPDSKAGHRIRMEE